MHLYIGTSTVGDAGRGIYSVPFEPASGAFGEPVLAAEASNATFLALAPDGRHLYSVSEYAPLVAGYAVDPAGGALRPLATTAGERSKAPSHIALDAAGRTAVISHYHAGYVAAVAISPEGIVGARTAFVRHDPRPDGRTAGPGGRQDGPHVHSAVFSPDGRRIAVCDLGLDRVFLYRLQDGALVSGGPPLPAAPGAGPRHSAYSADGRFLYVANELDSTVAAYPLAPGSADPLVVPTLPRDFSGQNLCAEIRLSPDSRHLYVSNRGHDSIAVFSTDPGTGALAPVETVSCGGGHPRHFALSPDGRWLICANRDSNNLVVFARDETSGRLMTTGRSATVPRPVCVLFGTF